MRRAVVYLRVSTIEQTTANQERELREVAGRMGCDIVKVYKDHGISGAKGSLRPRTLENTEALDAIDHCSSSSGRTRMRLTREVHVAFGGVMSDARPSRAGASGAGADQVWMLP